MEGRSPAIGLLSPLLFALYGAEAVVITAAAVTVQVCASLAICTSVPSVETMCSSLLTVFSIVLPSTQSPGLS